MALQAGTAKVKVKLDKDCFPNAECVGLHDDLYVRAVILESNHRFAFLCADMPSMFPEELNYCKQLLKEIAGIEPEYSWVTVTHSFSALHTWPAADNEQKDVKLPPALSNNPDMITVARRINKLFRTAYQEAVTEALRNMTEANIGFGTGSCFINVNRNIITVDGWWQGANQEGFADRVLSVIRVNDLSNRPIAVLYNYSVQSSVTAGKILPDGGKLVSADLPGVASEYIEREYGDRCTAVFMPCATGDQVPMYRINYCETDKDGKLRSGCLGESGYVLLAEQGRILGNEVVQIVERIDSCRESVPIRTASVKYTCKCQKKDSGRGVVGPSLHCTFLPNGETTMTVHAAVIGDIAMVGLQPEIDGCTISEIRNGSPFSKTIVATLVNGSTKCMPQKSAYSRRQYTALNSPFAEGSAEYSRDVAINLLKDIWEQQAFH